MTGRRKGFIAAFLGVLAALLMTMALSAPGASAQATCNFDDYVRPDGSIDMDGYLACIQGSGAENTGNQNVESADGTQTAVARGDSLPRTGNDTGRNVAIGSALILLGGAAVFGSMRARKAAAIRVDQ